VDQRADVYSIGAMLYGCTSCWRGGAHRTWCRAGASRPTGYRILDEVLEGPPKPIESIRKGVPAGVVAIVGS
jgi:hypothetical protein